MGGRMRIPELIPLLGLLFLLLMDHPKSQSFKWEKNLFTMERQEEVINPITIEDEKTEKFKLTFTSPSEEEEALADILWMQAVAHEVLDRGFPYFKIKNQTISKKYDRSIDAELSSIYGEIECTLIADQGNFDAEEISRLELHPN